MEERYELRDSGIIFNEAEHTYYDPIADKYLSGITSAIQNQLAKGELDNIPSQILDEATRRGKECHASIEKFTTQWINDGSQSVQDFIDLCNEHGICPERAEYTVRLYDIPYASNIDLVARVDNKTFDLYDIKSYGRIDAVKMLKASYQLSIYSLMFSEVNPGATVRNLAILHIRNTEKEHISELVPIKRISPEACMELLLCELEGRQFTNDPLAIPEDVKEQETLIRSLLTQKAEIEERLSTIKNDLLNRMQAVGAKQWSTGTMRLSVKAASQRTTFNVRAYQEDNPELDLSSWYKTTEIAPSLQVAV